MEEVYGKKFLTEVDFGLFRLAWSSDFATAVSTSAKAVGSLGSTLAF
jgi:hypothetical protein